VNWVAKRHLKGQTGKTAGSVTKSLKRASRDREGVFLEPQRGSYIGWIMFKKKRRKKKGPVQPGPQRGVQSRGILLGGERTAMPLKPTRAEVLHKTWDFHNGGHRSLKIPERFGGRSGRGEKGQRFTADDLEADKVGGHRGPNLKFVGDRSVQRKTKYGIKKAFSSSPPRKSLRPRIKTAFGNPPGLGREDNGRGNALKGIKILL